MPGTLADAVRPQQKVAVAPVAELPDIYIFQLDGYPRAGVLERRFGMNTLTGAWPADQLADPVNLLPILFH